MIDKDVDYTQKDIETLISGKIEESLHLEYKSSGALNKTDKSKEEMCKDVSAFANADGGVLIYGIMEKDHLPVQIDGVNGKDFTKEWIEQVLGGGIDKVIEDLRIIPIRIDNDLGNTVYVLVIPRSDRAPHMVKDGRYYKRHEFESVRMVQYEVEEAYHRKSLGRLEKYRVVATLEPHDGHAYRVNVKVQVLNTSKVPVKLYKVNGYLRNVIESVGVEEHVFEKETTVTEIDGVIKISYLGTNPIFPEEVMDTLDFTIMIHKMYLDKVRHDGEFELVIFFEDGSYEEIISMETIMEHVLKEG